MKSSHTLILKKWKTKIIDGEFLVYSPNKNETERANNLDQLYIALERINRNKYPEGLETGNPVNATMWQSTSLPAGVGCGAEENVSGQFRSSNEQTKLENYIGADAWKVKEYWISKPHLPISKIKIEINNLIEKEFNEKGQISIEKIYSFLNDKNGRYGFMPCKKIQGRKIPKKSYSKNKNWGMEIKTNNRLDPQDGVGLRFGVVVTLKEMHGVNRIDEFIKNCNLNGWLVNKIDVVNRIDIHEKINEEIEFT